MLLILNQLGCKSLTASAIEPRVRPSALDLWIAERWFLSCDGRSVRTVELCSNGSILLTPLVEQMVTREAIAAVVVPEEQLDEARLGLLQQRGL